MLSSKDRLNLLKDKTRRLNEEICAKKLEADFEKKLQLMTDKKLEPHIVTEEEWEVMLPAEKEKNLLDYYLTIRTELLEMQKQSQLFTTFRGWLESPWIKISITVVSLVEVAAKLLELAHTHGLLFHDESDSSYLG